MRMYQYEINGSGSNNSWKLEGAVHCEFAELFDAVMRETFHALTHGKAIYGKPGLGCDGPYTISEIVIKLVLN